MYLEEEGYHFYSAESLNQFLYLHGSLASKLYSISWDMCFGILGKSQKDWSPYQVKEELFLRITRKIDFIEKRIKSQERI